MAMVLVFEEEIIRVIYANRPQAERSDCEKDQCCNEMASVWELQIPSEMDLGLGNWSGYVGRRIDCFEGVHSGYGGRKNSEERSLLAFCEEKEMCVVNTWFENDCQRKITYSMSGHKTEINFELFGISSGGYSKLGA